MKKIPTELHGDKISLRRLRPADAPDLYRYMKRREISQWLLSVPHPYPKDGAVKFIRKSQRQWRQQTHLHFAIILNQTGELIGGCGMNRVDFKHQCSEIGYWLGKKFRNHGYGTETAKLMLRFGFDHLKLFRMYAHALEINTASCRILEKSGMTCEGCWRQALIKNGKRQNLVHYAILKPEYEKLTRKKTKSKK